MGNRYTYSNGPLEVRFVFEYLIFSTCRIIIANCFSILRHGE